MGGCGFELCRSGFLPPITRLLLYLFIFLSFGSIELFAFYAFLWDLLTSVLFYFVLKSFDIKDRKYGFGLFLINPFWFLNNSFSLDNCGYHITDAFFLFFFSIALIYIALICLPKDKTYEKYLFYLFLGLFMCVKYYTLPALGLLFLKFFYERSWKELKILLECVVPLLITSIVIHFFYFD